MSEPSVGENMADLAEQAVIYARQNYKVELDYSEESLQAIELILAKLCNAIPKNFLARLGRKPPKKKVVVEVAALLGSYLGEVIRRRWGGEWTDKSEILPGTVYTLRVRGADVFPTAKCYKRLTIGPSQNIWLYYQVLKREFARHESEKP